MLSRIILMLAALIGAGVSFARAEVVNKDELPSRIELHAIPTLWISDQQFLAGDDKGKQVTVAGELRIAQRQGKTPIVILMHGSGGDWAQRHVLGA